MQIFIGNSYTADGQLLCGTVNFQNEEAQNATQGIVSISFFLNIESLRVHELLMKVAGMRLKSDFSAKVPVLRSMGNELVPSPLPAEGL